LNQGAMLNAYPDSLGGTLRDAADLLSRPECRDAFRSFYILPSIFNTDLDRGFSIISYDLNRMLADDAAIQRLKRIPLDLKMDFVLNHLSVLSPQFQDILRHGDASPYRDFFIDWNRFWDNCGQMTEQGYILPETGLIRDMFFRKPGLPILMVRFPDGSEVPYWNTFYQEVRYPRLDPQDLTSIMDIQYAQAAETVKRFNEALDQGIPPGDVRLEDLECFRARVTELLNQRRTYLGQMDLDLRSPLVWDHYRETLEKLADYGASIVRLDAFAYAPKTPGKRNFMNEPETWELLERIRILAKPLGLTLLPEIHASYAEGAYEKLAGMGYLTYDFFLPGLIIDAIENQDGNHLKRWAEEILRKGIRVVNMLGCHDGIPLLDLKGLIPDERIRQLTDLILSRGGLIKNLHGRKDTYYQVNATYYSTLGEDDSKMLLARALQLFMPGKPQVWYLDLFAGKNDLAAVERGGEAAHKEINRTNLTQEQMEQGLGRKIVRDQLTLLRIRNTSEAFGQDAELTVEQPESARLLFSWRKGGDCARLAANLRTCQFSIETEANNCVDRYVFNSDVSK